MRLATPFGTHTVAVWLVCRLLAHYIRLLELTTRWTAHGTGELQRMSAAGEPFIVAFWHGRMVLMAGAWRRFGSGRTIHILISRHRDGQTVSRVISHLGIKSIAGSSSRGGAAALRTMLKTIKAGDYIGITPDGPRGPLMRASPGVARAASLSGVPVFVASYSAVHRRFLKSWNRFLLPLPFGRVVFVVGGPIVVPHGADAAALEMTRRRIEDALNEATREADTACGIEPTSPLPQL